MEVLHDGADCPSGADGCALTIGAFDGVHLGHRLVIERTRAEADKRGARTAVVTFDRHPASVVRPESAPRLLTTLEHKLELLEAAGVDYTYVVQFDAARAQEEASTFIERVLVDGLSARCVVVGEDFHFGRSRRGNVAMLREAGRTHNFDTLPLSLMTVSAAGAVVSSTAIRAAVAAGDVSGAAAMLGRWHELRGRVETGDQRGRTLGFPTANVAIPAEMALPGNGVYAAWYQRPDGSRHQAAVNVGRRPTFYVEADQSLVEAFLIDFEGDLYGEAARVCFVKLLRPEVRFESVDALVTQMRQDVADARVVLGALR